MDSNQNFCLEGHRYSQTRNQNVYKKVNPKTQKVVKIIKSTCTICGRNKSQTFTQ